MQKIPKIIHFFYDEDLKLWQKDKKPQFRMCYLSWLRHCSDYKIMHWHDNMPEFQDMLKKSKFLKRCYELKIWAFVSDYVRAYALNKYGGIYLDTDVQIINSFDDFLSNQFFISIEGELSNGKNVPEPAVMGGVSNHIVFKKILDFYNSNKIFNEEEFMSPIIIGNIIENLTHFKQIQYNSSLPEEELKNIYNSNNKRIHLDNLNQYLGQIPYNDTKYGISIYPCEYFCPDWSYFKEHSITKNTVCIHWNQSSLWGTEEDNLKINKLKNTYKKFTKYPSKITPKKWSFKESLCFSLVFIKKWRNLIRDSFIKLNDFSFIYENSELKLFQSDYNCGYTDKRMTERCLEIAIAKKWLENTEGEVFEIGAVTPYYFPHAVNHICDPYDKHIKVDYKCSMFDINLTNKNVICLSTIEHIGTGDYNLKAKKNENAIFAFEKIVKEANTCLITFPVGHNKELDKYFSNTSLKNYPNISILMYERNSTDNCFIETNDFKNILKKTYGPIGANAVVIINKNLQGQSNDNK
ncbi:MAG: hypothetical protein LKG27_04490 [Clostridiaceae bacterium]|jgi:hypothetical protein|nr:hypothetical protein [Clostridiaceae bacterium]